MTDQDDVAERFLVAIEAAVDAISMILAGREPQEQGAIIAMLTARWLAGHILASDRAATAELREGLIAAHVEAVRYLIEPEEAGILERLRKRSH